MAHNSLILGRSQYGKSSLAKALCRAFRRSGRRVIVFDILADDWDADFVTADREEFLEIFWGSFDVVAFVEEAGHSAGKGETEMILTATTGRHQVGAQGFGNSCYYSCHRLNQLDVTLRAQCPELYLFASRADDARDLYQEYGHKELLEAPSLPQGDFFHVAPGEPLTKHHVDFRTLKITRIYTKPEGGSNDSKT